MSKQSRRFVRPWLIFAPSFLVFLVLDQWTKSWANSTLIGQPRTDFGFQLTYNNGIVFGIPMPLWGSFLMTAVILGMGLYLVIDSKLWRKTSHLLALALILAGALGNLVDRVRLGKVIDFIQVYWWPTFNLADAWLVIGVILLGWDLLIQDEITKKV